MKKVLTVILSLCLLFFVSAFTLSCSNVETFTFSIDLNGGSYTEAYKTANNYSSNNVSHITSPKLAFDKVYEKLPQASDIIPPKGKVLAGWYTEKDCTPESLFNEKAWLKATQEGGSERVYAYYIDVGNVALTVDLDNDGATLTDAYKAELGITYDYPRFVGTPTEILAANLPTASDVIVPENKYFGGWYLDKAKTLALSAENVLSQLTQSAALTLYAKWDVRMEIGITFLLFDRTGDPSEVKSYVFDEAFLLEMGGSANFPYELGFRCYIDELYKVEALVEDLYSHVTYSLDFEPTGYVFGGWRIITHENGEPVYLEVTEENILRTVAWAQGQSFAPLAIYATWLPAAPQ